MTKAKVAFQVSTAVADATWNSITSTSVGEKIADMDDDGGTATGWSFSIDVAPSFANTLGISSVGSGDAAWVDDAAISDEHHQITGVNKAEYTIAGLDNSKTYVLEYYGSAEAIYPDSEAEISIDDSTWLTTTTDTNTSATNKLTNISPTSGAITLYFRRDGATGRGVLNALRIIETATLSGVSITDKQDLSVDVNVTTDIDNGWLYAVITTSATQPTAIQIRGGQDHLGNGATSSANQAVTSTGAKTFNDMLGVFADTTFYAHIVHYDSGDNESNVISSAGFTSNSTPPVTVTKSAQNISVSILIGI